MTAPDSSASRHLAREDLLIGGRHPLGYCTNVHPAPDLTAAEEVYRGISAGILFEALGEGPHLLGAWWPEDLARELCEDEARREAHGDLCEELGLRPYSLNVFPMGRFHGAGVKEKVYDPDWRSDARLSHTLNTARAAASLARRWGGDRIVLSTLPLGFRGRDRGQVPEEAHLHQLFRLVQALSLIEEETGIHVEVGLEPEPWCVLETLAETRAFLSDRALPHAAAQGDEAAMRRHLGVCLDLCHAAVMGEDALAEHRALEAEGLRLCKVQLSTALELREPGEWPAMRSFDEEVWMHQLRWQGAGGGSRTWVDLGDPGLEGFEPGDGDSLRCHFHVPLHRDEVVAPSGGRVGTTQAQLLAFLDLVCAGGLRPGLVLEVETYTNPDIGPELSFVADRLQGVA